MVLPRRPDSAPAQGRGTPGPGQYEDVLATKKSAPKYGMGTGCARGVTNKDALLNPAPNAYSPTRNSTLFKSPTWVMGTDKRRPLSGRNTNPGPGNYSLSSSLTGPAVSITL